MRVFSPLVGLAFNDVVSRDQLQPQPIIERVFGGKPLKLTDNGVSASACDFGFRHGGMGAQFVF